MVDIIIKGLGADNIAAGKFTHSSAAITASVKRPAIFKEVLLNVVNKLMLLEKIRFAATILAMTLINVLTLLCFIALNFDVIQLNSTSFDLLVNCTRRAANFSCNGTQRAMILQTGLDNNPLFER